MPSVFYICWSSQHSTYLAPTVVQHQRPSSPTLEDLLATVSDSDSDSDSINAQPNNSTNPTIPNVSDIDPNQDRPVFSLSRIKTSICQ